MDKQTEKAIKSLPTPAYVVDEGKLIENLKLLSALQRETGVKILLAQKAFSCFAVYPLISKYLSGTTASGLYEAKLASEEFQGENHVFAPAFKDKDMEEIATICDHIVFNSYAQYKKHHDKVKNLSIGIRVNPEFSTQDGAIYDPCAEGSRLGMTYSNVKEAFGDTLPEDIEGLHFHTLCEQGASELVATFSAFEKKFARYLRQVKWLNMGGGHHITKKGYDIPLLRGLINYIKAAYGVQVYLEPGEAIALNAGYLVTEVEDIVHNGMDILILDASAECHTPDVLEMPYRPPLFGGHLAGKKPYTYRLSSLTCLAGDVIGDYSFETPVSVGDKLVFGDMAIYSMVKNNTFNGMPLPSIYLLKENGETALIKAFDYSDFKGRLS